MQRPKQALVAFATTSLVALSLAGCGAKGGTAQSDGSGSGTLKVVATTTQVADFVRHIGKGHVDALQLTKPNASPHEYEPTPADLQAIGKAKLLFENGVGLEEEWLDKPVQAAGFSGRTVDTSAGVKLRQGHDEHEHGEHAEKHDDHSGDHSDEHHHDEQADDPHIWHNPRFAKIMCENIRKALIKADPAHKSDYQANFTAYAAQLDALDKDIAHKIGSLPEDSRKLVTNHDAFGYYIDRYHLTYVGAVIPDFSDQAELSGNQIDGLVKKIKAQKVKAVFGESSLPPKTTKAIARQAGVKVIAGDGSLYGDSLGPKGSAGDTYLKSERFNIKTIVDALK
ncbi:zinc/manganese transport system substrate-binding protein/manganese/iron transport system substrate-binding protein [Streptomyces sp. 2112.3]|uniref:metal ABC transporter substrate-binding protein n=1 Tax=Streptomyces sp. 2112.3 TaxID=1881023 RepID=UPI000898006A|nr:metal ABC transporter substrate-binding protein [Streptomyces sp. 2112.3]SED85720.1 zinc/manganese transport system substrate-binding protein/manganese/iron transport system substrate-binding protein [Streptomyces sp. 2112.3]